MPMVTAKFRPLVWATTSTPTRQRRSRATFKASWSDTLSLLDRELRHLDARDIVIEADLREGDIRLDGWPRSGARVGQGHPGVRVAFESKHGPLVYATDSCAFWEHNLRSIALGLESLRAVDRYGVTRRGEQYTGWREITAAPAETVSSTAEAWELLVDVAGVSLTHDFANTIARARRAAHPDTGGSAELWDKVQAAATLVQGAKR